VLGELTNAYKRIHRRHYDDLPQHVKGTVQFNEDNVHPYTNRGYYILHNDQTYAVEFLRTEDDTEHWYLLVQVGGSPQHHWFTKEDHRIDHFTQNTGYWDLTDPQHHNYVPEADSDEEPAAPAEELVAGGIHHIVTLQGPQTLDPTPQILPEIQAAVAVGVSIPVNIPPAASASHSPSAPVAPAPMASTSAPAPAPAAQLAATTTTTTGGSTQPVNIINPSGSLKGNPPVIFNGDRTKSRGFLVAFDLYKGLNRTNTSMTNPYSRVLNLLTYIEGDKVNAWKEAQLKKLEARVTAGTPETSEVHWTTFIRDFKDAFTNTNAKAEAYQALTRLRHTDNLDSFIAEFKKLVDEAEIDADSFGTIELFKTGLKGGLTQALIGRQDFNPVNPWPLLSTWIEKAHEEHIKWKTKQQYSQRGQQLRQHLLHSLARKKGNGGRRTTSQGGDAMDIDATSTNSLSDEQRAEYMKANKCFYCSKIGHRAKDCHKKKRDKSDKEQRANAPQLREATSSTTFDLKAFGEALKEHGPNLDEDAKLNLVEMLLPEGFAQALN
jgi:hypothetical protein